MRLPSFFTIGCFFLHYGIFAQEEIIQPISTSVYSDNRIILPFTATYRLPAFTSGTIIYRNGTKLTVKLNYNLARDEIHFINETGDTMVLTDPPTISVIIINHNRFYYHKDHYLQIIQDNDIVSLAFRQEINVHLFNNASPYSSANLSVKNNTAANPPNLSINGLKFETEDGRTAMMYTTDFYYLGDGYGNFSKADKANFLHFCKKNKQAFSDFITEQHTNFDKLGDLMELMTFCRELK